MPEIIVYAVEGRTAEQKKSLMKDITDAVVNNFQVPLETVTVQIVELKKDSKAKGGVPFTERERRAAAAVARCGVGGGPRAPIHATLARATTRDERFMAARRNRNSLLFPCWQGIPPGRDTPNDPSRHRSGRRGRTSRRRYAMPFHGLVCLLRAINDVMGRYRTWQG